MEEDGTPYQDGEGKIDYKELRKVNTGSPPGSPVIPEPTILTI